MKKFCSIIGTRPQFIKASPLSNVLRKSANEVVIHTGQHYDHEMSSQFFSELKISIPDYNLEIGSGTHGTQTGAMLPLLEDVLVKEKPDAVIVYGDTNSTLAGALAAAKLQIPIAHIEAGLRSFNRKMPEEINRVLIDHVSSLLFTPSEVSRENLEKEGITEGVYIVGDIMYDSILLHGKEANTNSNILSDLGLESKFYYIATVHRAENTDNEERMNSLFDTFSGIDREIIIPLHPRTKKQLEAFSISVSKNVKIINPVGYLDMLQLLQNAFAVLTDSGGVQKEAYYFKVPCITLRSETEWTETIDVGWNKVVDVDPAKILEALNNSDKVREKSHPELYGDGDTSNRIVNVLTTDLI